jgi:hypothetical protein
VVILSEYNLHLDSKKSHIKIYLYVDAEQYGAACRLSSRSGGSWFGLGLRLDLYHCDGSMFGIA